MYRDRRHASLLAIPCVLVLLLTFAACGTNYAGSGSTSTGSPSATQTSTASSPATEATATAVQSQDALDGCPNKQVSTTPPQPATVTLTAATHLTNVTVNTGDTVEIDLSSGISWGDPMNLSQNILTMQTPSGYEYSATSMCIWRFLAVGSGTASLSFTGRPICTPKHACPQFMLQPIQFVVSVK